MIRINEQIRSARPDISAVLSASAGSGKTRALIMRLMHLLFAGARPESIAAVTFTEKAAAEMKDRLYGELSRAAESGISALESLGIEDKDAPYGLPKSPEQVLSELLSRPDTLKVQTIHALCLWLIRRFSAESGILPGFNMADEAQSKLMMDRAVEDTFSDIARSGETGDIDALVSLGLGINHIKDALVAALGMRSQVSAILLSGGGAEAFIAALGKGLDECTRELEDALGSGNIRRLAGGISGMLARYGLEEAVDDGGYREAMDALGSVRDRGGLAGAFRDTYQYFLTQERNDKARSPLTLDAVKKALVVFEPGLKGKARDARSREIREQHDETWTGLRDELVRAAGLCDLAGSYEGLIAFMNVFGAAEERYGYIKESAGMADFDDLEIGAYRLLYGPHSVDALLDVEPRLTHYLLDEFQDTSGLQWMLVQKLAAEAFAGAGAEGVGGSTLFAVGDMKQSIYRFRNANYRLIRELGRLMDERIAPDRHAILELTSNFRSAPEVMRVVDETFSSLFGGEYKPTSHTSEGRSGSVRLAVSDAGGEYEKLASLAQEYFGIEISGKEAGETRAAGYGDMAVLIRSRGVLPDIEAAFAEHGIPYRVLGGVGFFDRPEVRAMLGLLRFIDDPGDGLSLEAALRSKLFGFSKLQTHHVLSGGDYTGALASHAPDVHGLIESLRAVSGLVSCGRLVDMAVNGSGALGAFSSGSATAHLNLEKLRSLSEEFDREAGGGLGDYLRWLDNYQSLGDIGSADPETDGGGVTGAVSIMTVHAAKGLEFPVVFLPGTARKIHLRQPAFLAGGASYDRMALRTDTLTKGASLYDRLKEEEHEELLAESDRLLYVAMTRARDHLVITAEHKSKPERSSWLHRLVEAAPPSLFGDEPEALSGPRDLKYPGGPPCYIDNPSSGAYVCDTRPESPAPELIAPITPARQHGYATPSSLASELADPSEQASPWPPMLRGGIVHSALESFGREGTYDVHSAARGFSGFHSLPSGIREALVSDVEDSLSRLLGVAEINDIILSGDTRHHELELMVLDGDMLIAGSADLVTLSGDSARVVDYKTGFTDLPARDIAEAYRPQLDAYALAVRAAFGVTHVEKILVLTDRAEAVYL